MHKVKSKHNCQQWKLVVMIMHVWHANREESEPIHLANDFGIWLQNFGVD